MANDLKSSILLRSSPHRLGTESVPKVMWTVALALAPACLVSLWFFGIRALVVLLGCVLGCMVFEYLFTRLRYPHETALKFSLDGSAVVTGMLLAMNLPAASPWWLVLAGAIVALSLGKHVFGGLGQNVFNPALVARVFLLLSFPSHMTAWTVPQKASEFLSLDAVSTATPLGAVKATGLDKLIDVSAGLWDKFLVKDFMLDGNAVSLWDMFIGQTGGSLGETSVLALLIGALILFWRKLISWHIPLTYIGSVFVLTGIFFVIDPNTYASPVLHVLSAGLILGAFFMATDMVTSPVSAKGMVIFGIGCGVITVVIRLFASLPEGVSFAILIMNGLTPLIDRYTRPLKFGEVKTKKAKGGAVSA